MNSTENKKRIKFMSDYADLFLALYAVKTENGIDDKIYLPLNFELIFEYIFQNFSLNVCKVGIVGENHIIDPKEFLSRLKLSTVKKYWRNDYIFDFDKNAIMVEVNAKSAKEEIEKYDNLSIEFINAILDSFIKLAAVGITNEDIEKLKQQQSSERKYIFKSED